MKCELSLFNSIKSYGNILHSNCDDSDSILKVQTFVNGYLSFSLRKLRPKL
jgi:hypothetical protein